MDEQDQVGQPAEDAGLVEAPRRGLWQRLAGDGQHLGFWTLPVFVATALGGAVIAGSIANVYYGQQVAALEDETRAARTAAEVAATDIEAARQEALAAIGEQVDAVRDALEAARPLADPASEGVVAMVVELAPEPAPSPSPAVAPQEPAPAPTESTGGDGQLDGALAAATTQEPTTAPPTSSDSAPPAVPGAPTRPAVGFVVAVDGDTVFLATSYGAVADPRSRDGVAPAVTVATPGGTARGVVHAWDEARHVAVVRVRVGALPILPWRPAALPVEPGAVSVLAAVTPDLVGVQLPGRVGAVTATILVTDLPLDPLFDGAPVLDAQGRVVGLQASTANPFGRRGGGVIPAAQLCVELVSGCDLLEQPDETDEVSQQPET